jgi:1-deoxy-D-xylulose-5-phosphate reductoisomerase
MRLPIGYALAYPERITTPFGRIDWGALGRLDFEPPDLATFRCLGLAYAAGRIGGTAPAWLNAANEVVVEAFLKGQIPWIWLADVLETVLARHDGAAPDSLEAVIEADHQARRVTRDVIEKELHR